MRALQCPFFIPVLLWPTQITALTSHAHELFERRVGALAVLLGIEDQAILGPMAPQIGAWSPAVRRASECRVSIFGSPDLMDSVTPSRAAPDRMSQRPCLLRPATRGSWAMSAPTMSAAGLSCEASRPTASSIHTANSMFIRADSRKRIHRHGATCSPPQAIVSFPKSTSPDKAGTKRRGRTPIDRRTLGTRFGLTYAAGLQHRPRLTPQIPGSTNIGSADTIPRYFHVRVGAALLASKERPTKESRNNDDIDVTHSRQP